MNKIANEVRNVDSYELIRENYKRSGAYINATRALANGIDGLKVVYRRMLWTCLQHPDGKFIKSTVITGECMKLHPHGEQPGVLYSLVNSRLSLYDKQGNFGGYNIAGSAPRYTESRLNKHSRLYLGQDLINYCEMIEGDIGYPEPYKLPTLIPFICVEGNNSMGIGISTSIGRYDAIDMAKFYRSGLTGEKYNTIKLAIGNVCVDATVSDVSKMTRNGEVKGLRYYLNPEVEGKNTIVITSVPPGMSVKKIERVMAEYVDKGRVDFRDESNANLRLVYEIKKGKVDRYLDMLKSLSSTESYDLVFTEGDDNDSAEIVYTGLDRSRSACLKYLRECADRKFNHEIKSIESKLGKLRVIKYMKDNGIVKKLDQLSMDELIKLLPFDKDDIVAAMKSSINRLMRGAMDEEISELEDRLTEANGNLVNRDNYLIKLYDDFISDLESHYVNETKYKDEVDESVKSKLIKSGKLGFYAVTSDCVVHRISESEDAEIIPDVIRVLPVVPGARYMVSSGQHNATFFDSMMNDEPVRICSATDADGFYMLNDNDEEVKSEWPEGYRQHTQYWTYNGRIRKMGRYKENLPYTK